MVAPNFGEHPFGPVSARPSTVARLKPLGYNRASVAQRSFREARFVTVSEVAQLMRVSKMTVYRLIKQGDLPAFRVGRGYRMREEDVHRYLDSRYTEAG
jgi:excisionase family DNA binding protein